MYWHILQPNSAYSVLVKAETEVGALNAYAIMQGYKSIDEMERKRGLYRCSWRVTRA